MDPLTENSAATGGSDNSAPQPAPAAPVEQPPAEPQPQPAAGEPGSNNPSANDQTDPNGKDNTGPGTERTDEGGNPAEPEYAFEYPEEFKAHIDPVADDMLKAYAKDKGYTPEQASDLSNLRFDMIRHLHTSIGQQQEQQKQVWEQELRADPDFGGVNYDRTREEANKGLRHFAPELVDKMAPWNLENQPDVIRVFARLGRSLSENTSPKGDNPAEHRARTLVDEKQAVLDAETNKARS